MEEKMLEVLRNEIIKIKNAIHNIDILVGVDNICEEYNEEMLEYLDGDKMEE